MALGVLEEVEAFRQALVAHDVARVRHGPEIGLMLPGVRPPALATPCCWLAARPRRWHATAPQCIICIPTPMPRALCPAGPGRRLPRRRRRLGSAAHPSPARPHHPPGHPAALPWLGHQHRRAAQPRCVETFAESVQGGVQQAEKPLLNAAPFPPPPPKLALPPCAPPSPPCLPAGSPSPVSSSRLMAASWHLRSAPQPGAAVFSLPEVGPPLLLLLLGRGFYSGAVVWCGLPQRRCSDGAGCHTRT